MYIYGYMTTPTTGQMSGMQITNNTFDSVGTYGICYPYYNANIKINNNNNKLTYENNIS